MSGLAVPAPVHDLNAPSQKGDWTGEEGPDGGCRGCRGHDAEVWDGGRADRSRGRDGGAQSSGGGERGHPPPWWGAGVPLLPGIAGRAPGAARGRSRASPPGSPRGVDSGLHPGEYPHPQALILREAR